MYSTVLRGIIPGLPDTFVSPSISCVPQHTYDVVLVVQYGIISY